MIVREAYDGAVFADQGPHDVRMLPAVFDVVDPAPRRVLKSKLDFVVTNVRRNDGLGVGAIRRWIDVEVVHRPIRAPVRRRHHEVVDLLAQRLSHEVAYRHDFDGLAAFARHQMPSKSGAAGAPRFSGNHGSLIPCADVAASARQLATYVR